MKTEHGHFNEEEVLHQLKHYLPAQAPLKDFIHHNTLHAFQTLKFYDGLSRASKIFGYKVSLSLPEYRKMYTSGRILKDVLEKIVAEKKGENTQEWIDKLINKDYDQSVTPRIGNLRGHWKIEYHIDLDSLVQPTLFRILCSYLDQGISIWKFPVWHKGFLASIKEMERNSYTSFFKTPRARKLLLSGKHDIASLLKLVVGDEAFYEEYLFDQQFAHQGWSGMVAAIELQPEGLLDTKKITLHDLIVFELLMEIDALDTKFGNIWAPLAIRLRTKPQNILATVKKTELDEIISLWQDAFEWSYYDEVLAGLTIKKESKAGAAEKSFQVFLCIDDRECSIRRYLEGFDPKCETFTTPGFFGVEFFYKPEHGKFYTKLCPAPVTPKFLIKEFGAKKDKAKELHFNTHSHSLFRGWIISQTLGFWTAFKLFVNIFKPSMSPATASSFKHMDKLAKLTVENKNTDQRENDLQIGFTVTEMADRVQGVLMSTGLTKSFAPIVYIIGHGSSSVNNPHFAAYDCGACCGRPGSVNARVFSFMANHDKVRELLKERGIDIPTTTQFLGGLHDTTRDEIMYYDEESLSAENAKLHAVNEKVFDNALDANAKERSRRFESIDTHLSAAKIHDKIKRRSVSLFEPRPELNHATNALCIVGRRDLTKGLFLDRRAFTNSYNYLIDPTGKYLYNILKAAAPVCGGINLEYFFSRVDNQKLGAGTKLPHNVMGLFGVANGIDGDLRPGLPSQMIEVHDPVRLLIVVEHFEDIVLKTIQTENATYEWFINEWVQLAVINPDTKQLSVFKDGAFTPYMPLKTSIERVNSIVPILESTDENIPIYALD